MGRILVSIFEKKILLVDQCRKFRNSCFVEPCFRSYLILANVVWVGKMTMKNNFSLLCITILRKSAKYSYLKSKQAIVCPNYDQYLPLSWKLLPQNLLRKNYRHKNMYDIIFSLLTLLLLTYILIYMYVYKFPQITAIIHARRSMSCVFWQDGGRSP